MMLLSVQSAAVAAVPQGRGASVGSADSTFDGILAGLDARATGGSGGNGRAVGSAGTNGPTDDGGRPSVRGSDRSVGGRPGDAHGDDARAGVDGATGAEGTAAAGPGGARDAAGATSATSATGAYTSTDGGHAANAGRVDATAAGEPETAPAGPPRSGTDVPGAGTATDTTSTARGAHAHGTAGLSSGGTERAGVPIEGHAPPAGSTAGEAAGRTETTTLTQGAATAAAGREDAASAGANHTGGGTGLPDAARPAAAPTGNPEHPAAPAGTAAAEPARVTAGQTQQGDHAVSQSQSQYLASASAPGSDGATTAHPGSGSAAAGAAPASPAAHAPIAGTPAGASGPHAGTATAEVSASALTDNGAISGAVHTPPAHITHVNAQVTPAGAGAPPAPLPQQLSTALAHLRTAPEGHHVFTVRVAPDDLGPVRITAHIGAEGVRVEMTGMNDHAREALRATLAELRRDLAATGLQADLHLSSGSSGSSDGNRPGPSGSRAGQTGVAEGAQDEPGSTDRPPTPTRRDGSIDLFA